MITYVIWKQALRKAGTADYRTTGGFLEKKAIRQALLPMDKVKYILASFILASVHITPSFVLITPAPMSTKSIFATRQHG
jgi:hypothetical protein